MADSTRRAGEVRFVERLLGWLDANLPALPPGTPERRLLEWVAAELAARHGLPSIRSPRIATLDDASEEMLARLAEIGAAPMEPLTSEQWQTFGAGLPFTQDEIAESSARAAREWLPNANGRPKVVIASVMHSCGIVKGALVESWRR